MLCTRGVSFLLLPLYTALLSTEDYGTVDLVNTIVSLLAYTFTLQFEQSVFRFMIDSRGDEKQQKKLVTTTLTTVTVSSVIGIAITSAVCSILDFKYLFYLIINILATVYTSIVSQIARGLDKTPAYTAGNFISATAQIVFNIIFIVGLRWNVGGLLTASVVGKVLCIVFLIFNCRLYKYISPKANDIKVFREQFKYALPLVPNTLCWWLINFSDRIIITRFLGTGANGIYAVANKFPSLFSAVTQVFNLSWTENAAEANSAQDRERYFSKIMNQSVVIIISAAACIIAAMPFIFRVMINGDYAKGYQYIVILMVAGVFDAWAKLYGSLFGAVKYTKTIMTTTIVAAIVNLTVNLALIKSIGLFAASVSTLASYVVITVMRHIEISKIVRIRYSVTNIVYAFVVLGIACASYYMNKVGASLAITVALSAAAVYKNRKIVFPILKNVPVFGRLFVKKGADNE